MTESIYATDMMSQSNSSSPPTPLRQLAAWARPEAKRLRAASLLGGLDVVCVVGFAWGLSHLVTLLWGRPDTVQTIVPALAAVALSLVARAVLGMAGQRLNLRIARRVIAAIRQDVTAKALDGHINDQGRLNSLFEDTEALEGYYARFRQAQVSAALAPLFLIAVAATQSPVCAGLLLLTMVPFLVLMALLGMSSAAESKRQLDALARLSNLFIDRIKALPLILAFEDGPRQTRAVGRAAQEVAERTLRVLKVAFLTSAVLEFFSALSVAMIAVYCGFSLLHQLPFHVPEQLTLSRAFFVLALSPEVFAPMRRLSAAYHDRQTAVAATERLIALPVAPEHVQDALPESAPLLRYDKVVCGFPDDPDFRIGPVSFIAAPGSVTALTGPTGAGKTTLLRLLMGQGEVTSGAVTLNGQSVRDAGRVVAWVSQSPPILAGTLRDNLLLANPGADEAALMRAVTITGLDDLVARRGLDAELNERGSGLSGGERKRVGLARALLKDAPILLLDEPTADLDAAAEQALLDVLPSVFAGRTVLFSSHSPRLCALADREVGVA